MDMDMNLKEMYIFLLKSLKIMENYQGRSLMI